MEEELIRVLFNKCYKKYLDEFINTNLSAEDFYISELNRILLSKINIGYSKNSKLLLELFLKGKTVFRGKLLNIGISNKSLDSIYLELFTCVGLDKLKLF